MRFIYDNLAVIYVALTASLLGWLFGGTDADVLTCSVPWLFLFMLEIIFLFPQKHPGESTYEARSRVWRAMKKDPLVWTSIGLILLLAIPFVNNGLCVGCDRALIAQGHSPEPPIGFLPFCVNRMHHLNVFLWFVIALSSLIAVRHCLRSEGKRLLIEMIVWNGFALAILGFVQIATEAPGPLWRAFTNVDKADTFFSTFGYPNMAGDYFTTLFGLSVAVWRYRWDVINEEFRQNDNAKYGNRYRLFWRRNIYLIPAALFFFAATSTLSRAAMMLVTSLAAVYFVHSFISMTHRMSRAARVRRGTIALAIAFLAVFFAIISMPEDVQKEVDTLDADAVLNRVTGKGQYHVRVATELWKDNFLFGCGGWGYKHFCIPKMTPEELKSIQKIGGINVHNDYLQFLAEHGIVGFGAMVAIVLMLLAPIGRSWKRLVKNVRFAKGRRLPPKPVQIFALPSSAFCILMTTLATFIHSFGDCILRTPAILSLFLISMAAVPGFISKHTEDNAEDNTEDNKGK